MFGTIRRHQTWLWALIITVIVISFVIYFSPYSRMNNDRRNSVDYGSINGERISERQFAQARREIELFYFFMSGGQWPEEEGRNSRFDPMQETYKWLLLIQKQEQFGIHVSDDTAAQMAQALVRQFERKGITSPALFVDKVLPTRRLDADDFERYVRHYVGLQELVSAVALSGRLVLPEEATLLYTREHQEVSTEAVLFEASNYLAAVTVKPEALAQFYSNNLAAYIIPERRQVTYVKFDFTNYLAQAESEMKTNLTELVNTNFTRIGTNAATLFPEAKTPEQVKAKIRERILEEKALHDFIRPKVVAFANTLLDTKPVRPENLLDLARSNNLPTGVSAPFGREDEPKDLKVGTDFTKATFQLTPLDPFAGPFVGQDGVYEIALNKTIPRETPTLDQIKDQVTADYKLRQATSLARQAAQTTYQSFTNGLAQGKTFATLCADAKLKPISLPPFSLSTRELPDTEGLSLEQLQRAAFSTSPNKLSPLVGTSEGAMFLYLKSLLPLDPAKMRAELPAFTSQVRRRGQDDAFNQWFGKEAEKALRNVPLLARPQQASPPTMGSGNAKS